MENPYESPNKSGALPTLTDKAVPRTLYASALLGGRFGLKWTTIIIGTILLIVFLASIALVPYRGFYDNDWSDITDPNRRRLMAELVGGLFMVYAFCCFAAFVIGGIIYSIDHLANSKSSVSNTIEENAG